MSFTISRTSCWHIMLASGENLNSRKYSGWILNTIKIKSISSPVRKCYQYVRSFCKYFGNKQWRLKY